jgi:hypothetical protein
MQAIPVNPGGALRPHSGRSACSCEALSVFTGYVLQVNPDSRLIEGFTYGIVAHRHNFVYVVYAAIFTYAR